MGIKKVERSKAYFECRKQFFVASEAQARIEAYNFRQLLKKGIIRQEKPVVLQGCR